MWAYSEQQASGYHTIKWYNKFVSQKLQVEFYNTHSGATKVTVTRKITDTDILLNKNVMIRPGKVSLQFIFSIFSKSMQVGDCLACIVNSPLFLYNVFAITLDYVI